MMKCPNCGSETEINICNLCGAKIMSEGQLSNEGSSILQLLKKVSLPVKAVMILWTLAGVVALFPSSQMSIFQKTIIFIFGLVFYSGITHLIYKLYKKKHSVVPSPVNTQKENNSDSNSISSMDYDNMDGHTFEYFCADILKKNGFLNVEVTPGSGDHGIDILAEKDGISYAVQCKCYSSNIGNAAVQQAHTGKSIYQKDIAVVFTNRYFTAQAKAEANALGVKLWDREKLDSLINNSLNN